MNAGTYCALIMAGTFAILELGMLLLACTGQFEKGFDGRDAMGAFIGAFAFGAMGTMFSLVAMATCRFKNRLVNLAPLSIIWGGFAIVVLLGAILHEIHIVHR